MRITSILLPFLLIGCGPNLIGDWEGTCEFASFEILVELSIEEQDGQDLSGDAALTVRANANPDEPTRYEGEFEGERDGDEVEFEIVAGVQPDIQNLDIIGELVEDDEIEGNCGDTLNNEAPIRLDLED